MSFLANAAHISSASSFQYGRIDVIPVDGAGVLLSCLAMVLVIALGFAVHATSERSAANLDERKPLKKNPSGSMVLEDGIDNFQVAAVALGGSFVLLTVVSLVGWYSSQLAPLAVTAVGISVMFTLRPVRVAFFETWVLSFNMGTAPWLCILWQICVTAMHGNVVVDGILGDDDGGIRPWTVLVTFVGAVYLCMSLEMTGCLVACAHAIANRFSHSPPMLFLCICCLAACMTVLIPDDVVTMTLAPTVCLLCTSLQLDAEPHLYGQFYNANIFAVTLVTGNITNVLIAEVTGDLFLSFARTMVLPGLIAGIAAVLCLYFHFGSVLHDSAQRRSISTAANVMEGQTVRYPIRAVCCALRLAFTFIFAAFDGYHHWPIWMTIGVFAFTALMIDVFFDILRIEGTSSHMMDTVKALPYDIFLFFPALFVLVQQMVHVGAIDKMAEYLVGIALMPATAMVVVGFLSMWIAQAVSAIPMTILLVQVITRVPEWHHPSEGSDAKLARDLSLYAVVLGSNFCGNVTRMGTMGGQMWFKIAKWHDIVLSDVKMILRGAVIMTFVMAVALAMLYFSYTQFGAWSKP
eukprot:gnl/MRDRNA2_/MRDRNA2_36678_c0_seq1.p1 gnl/MRDRNA2_/MRDRNA2_36678_c0~~gnl/MRDRNA2_/MRDRNA2_36678_c0_seq1.p1  ORF type:complete len:577 (+),score=72.64 gnl/MRDRNA2_/MRDRNA2_36678_c0_seq1:164-1894(+)